MLAGERVDGRSGGGEAEELGLPGPGAGQHRIDQRLEHLRAEATDDEACYGEIGARQPPELEEVPVGAQRAGGRERPRTPRFVRRGGNPMRKSRRELAQPLPRPNERPEVCWGDELRPQPQLAAERGGPWFPVQEGVGPGFGDDFVVALGPDLAA